MNKTAGDPAELHSGIVIRPNRRLPLRGQHRNCARFIVHMRARTCFPFDSAPRDWGKAPENVGGF